MRDLLQLRHFSIVHLQVDHRVSSPIVLFGFRGLELGWHRHVGEPRHAGEVCVSEGVQTLYEPDLFLEAVDLAVQLGVFPLFWWCWRWWGGVGVRMSFRLLVVGMLVIFLPLVLAIRVSLCYELHKAKEFIELSFKSDHGLLCG
uniref:Uncharacterized protein n=1 Tax=Fagus sylvatica TaxID=28930 RepID=A0A2N9GZ04_FAGSY